MAESEHTVVVVCGLPASGKTTTAQFLVRCFPSLAYCGTDLIRAQQDLPVGQPEATLAAYDYLGVQARDFLASDLVPLLDATFSLRAFRWATWRHLKDLVHGLVIIEMVTPALICKSRIASRATETGRSLALDSVDRFVSIARTWDACSPLDLNKPFSYIKLGGGSAGPTLLRWTTTTERDNWARQLLAALVDQPTDPSNNVN